MKAKTLSIGIVLIETFKIIYTEFIQICILFLINTTIIFLIYHKLIHRNLLNISKGINQSMIVIYIVSLPLSLFINTYLTQLIKDNILKKRTHFKERLSTSIINVKYYFIGSILLLLSYFGFILLLSIVIFVPFINDILFLLLVLLFFLFVNYFRFIPYSAVLTESYSNLYCNTFYLLKTNFIKSFLLLLLFGILINVFGNIQYNATIDLLIDKISLPKFIIIFLLFELINYLSIITDIVFISLLYKEKHNNLLK